ncbi:hypothetical protein [Citrobacter braakii]|uniref:hypothetical protein n=1 Tax=Citrobacter braakii TaxID=57706 RepID=UPI00226DE1AB|nr:hypothetical protein [Citrobacter braakii]WAD33094.1 hypothetical protein MKJ05_11025 [Citrobacter braakii]
MNYNFLAPELVMQLHDSILAITKGLPGVKEPELVERYVPASSIWRTMRALTTFIPWRRCIW